MTRASHHHRQCPARWVGDDHCACSWRLKPRLPEDQRYLLIYKIDTPEMERHAEQLLTGQEP